MLVVSLTNIGDVVLTTPVMDALLNAFPQAKLTVVVGPKAWSLYEGQPRITTVIFEKRKTLGYYWQWYKDLRSKRFDVIIDLRQTFLPLFLWSQWRTPIWATKVREHMLKKHLSRLMSVFPQVDVDDKRLSIVSKEIQLPFNDYIVVAPGAADEAKRWPIANFKELIGVLSKRGVNIVCVGDSNDAQLLGGILEPSFINIISLAGKTDLRELGFVLSKSRLLIAHDSGIMHLANYLNVPQVILWGPTDLEKYSPWGAEHVVVYKGRDISQITIKDVLDAIEQIR